MNIHSAIIKGTNILKNHYIKTARLDTEILMAKVLKSNREFFILNNDRAQDKHLRRTLACYLDS